MRLFHLIPERETRFGRLFRCLLTPGPFVSFVLSLAAWEHAPRVSWRAPSPARGLAHA